MRRTRLLVSGAWMTWLLLATAFSQNQLFPCQGRVWSCQPNCYRAELIQLKADCTTPMEGVCCLFIYALHACREEPDCSGDREGCGNTQERKLQIVRNGTCEPLSGGVQGYRCGDDYVQDGGGNSRGVGFIVPPRCGAPVQVQYNPEPEEGEEPTPVPTPPLIIANSLTIIN